MNELPQLALCGVIRFYKFIKYDATSLSVIC